MARRIGTRGKFQGKGGANRYIRSGPGFVKTPAKVQQTTVFSGVRLSKESMK